jgi:inward rectifier potassium channel
VARRPSQRAAPKLRTVGGGTDPWGDGFHAFLRAPWPLAVASLVAAYLALNAVFAAGYLAVGGVVNARPGSLRDAFYFSVQTMGTIGYGAMYPAGEAANVLVVIESITGLLVTALATGLVFAKFGRTTARVEFIDRAPIHPYDGVPTLALRVGNGRSNQIVDAHFRVVLTRTERTREGHVHYRMYDLALVRDQTTALARTYTVMHRIEAGSPLFGYTPERLREDEGEISVTVYGLDDTTLQPVHATRTYLDSEVVWGARPADVLHFDDDGTMVVDLRRFHTLEPTAPIDGFAYPATHDVGAQAAATGGRRP